MGKTTLFHPVSLLVIRAAADYCGWKFGKITQTSSQPDELWARYVVEIKLMPREYAGKSNAVQLDALQQCFMDDIRCRWLRMTKTDKLLVDLIVNISKKYGEKKSKNGSAD